MKPIPGYSDYMATGNGRIFSKPSKSNVNKNGRILKAWEHPKGYLYVSLKKGTKKGWHKVHRLVALAWVPNPENKPQINHKNGDKTDNRPCNLEWCDNGYNQRHALSIGLKRGTLRKPL